MYMKYMHAQVIARGIEGGTLLVSLNYSPALYDIISRKFTTVIALECKN